MPSFDLKMSNTAKRPASGQQKATFILLGNDSPKMNSHHDNGVNASSAPANTDGTDAEVGVARVDSGRRRNTMTDLPPPPASAGFVGGANKGRVGSAKFGSRTNSAGPIRSTSQTGGSTNHFQQLNLQVTNATPGAGGTTSTTRRSGIEAVDARGRLTRNGLMSNLPQQQTISLGEGIGISTNSRPKLPAIGSSGRKSDVGSTPLSIGGSGAGKSNGAVNLANTYGSNPSGTRSNSSSLNHFYLDQHKQRLNSLSGGGSSSGFGVAGTRVNGANRSHSPGSSGGFDSASPFCLSLEGSNKNNALKMLSASTDDSVGGDDHNSGANDNDRPASPDKHLASTVSYSGTSALNTTTNKKGNGRKDGGPPTSPQRAPPGVKQQTFILENDGDGITSPFYEKSGPLASLIERRKHTTPSSAAGNNSSSSAATATVAGGGGGKRTASVGSGISATHPKPPNEPKRKDSFDGRTIQNQNSNPPTGNDGLNSGMTSPAGDQQQTTITTTHRGTVFKNVDLPLPNQGAASTNPRNNSVTSAPQQQQMPLYQQQQLDRINGPYHRNQSIGGGSSAQHNPLSVLNNPPIGGTGLGNGPRYSTTTFGAPTAGFSSMGITGLSVNAQPQGRQVGGAVGADGRFYSHVVLDSDPLLNNHNGPIAPLEMAGHRVSNANNGARPSVSVPNNSFGTNLKSSTPVPLSPQMASQSASVSNVSFSAAALAAVTTSNAFNTTTPQSRRRTSLFPEKHHKVTDSRYATVVLIPMTFGEGAQTFFASTALSRQRRTSRFGKDNGGPQQLPIIYSVKQLQQQRLIHLSLDMPAAVGGKPRYAPMGSYLSLEDMESAATINAPSSLSTNNAIELQAMLQRLSLYRAMQQNGQTLTPPQISDMQLLKKKLGPNAGLSGASSSSQGNSPARASSASVNAGVFAGLSRQSAGALLSNYDGAATVTAKLLETLLNPLASHALMDAPIQITDCGDDEVVREEQESFNNTAAINNDATTSGEEADGGAATVNALGDTQTFCVEDTMAQSSSASMPGSPLIAINGENPPPPTRIRAVNDDVANAIAARKSSIVVEVSDDNDASVLLSDTAGEMTVNSMSTLRVQDKIRPTLSSRSLNATTTNLNTDATIDSLFQRVAGKTPRPGDATGADNNNGGGSSSQLVSPTLGPSAPTTHLAPNNLNLAQRKAAQTSSASNLAIQMLFNENKSVGEAFKAAQAAAAAQVAANAAIPNVLQRGVVKDSAVRELNFAKKAREKRKRVAVLIGISKYEDRRIPTRDQCVEDCEAMSNILKNIGFRVIVLSTSAITVDGERDPDLYPTKANILKAIAEATKICKNEECIGLVLAFGGGYIGPVASGGGASNAVSSGASKADKEAAENAARRMSLAATQAGLNNSAGAVLVPPDVYLGQINASNTITLPDLEICGHDKGPKNMVYIDTFSVLGLKPCDGKYGGFCQAGGRKSIGSEIVAFYGEQQALLMAYYLKRGFSGYATRDSRITVNGLNAYLTRKLKKYDVLSLQSTASTFYIGDLDLARVHELRYCRYEINEIKAEQFAHFAKVHMMVIPTRNQDPSTVEFIRSIQTKFQKNMKPGTGPAGMRGPPMVCYSRLPRQRYHFFMRSVLPEKIYLNESAFIAHESKALVQFRGGLGDQNLSYQLLCYHSNLAGVLHIPNPVTRRQFLAQFDNSETIRKIKRLKKEAEAEKTQQLQAGRVHHLSKGAKLTAQAQLNQLMHRGGAGYLADTFASRFQVDGMAVHQVGIEMMLTFVTSEYIAQKMDKLVRVGALRQDVITSALMIKPLDEKALHVEKIVAKAQAIVRGYQTRKIFGEIIPLVKREQRQRLAIVGEQQRELLALQRNTFASHCGTLELVEEKQRDGWLEEYYDDRAFYWQEYIDSYGRAARKDKINLIRFAEAEDLLYREWFDFRCGFTAFAFSLMAAIYGMVKLQVKHDRSYTVILHQEDQERRLIMARWQRVVAGF